MRAEVSVHSHFRLDIPTRRGYAGRGERTFSFPPDTGTRRGYAGRGERTFSFPSGYPHETRLCGQR